MNKSRVFRKSDILYHIVKGWKMVLVSTVVGLIVGVTIIGAGYIRGEVSREYRVTTSVAVITTGTGKEYDTASPDQTNLNTARDLTDSALYVIKSRRNMEAVIADADLNGVTADDISRNLTVTRNGETEIIEITLLWRSEKEGLTIVNSLNKVTSSVMKETVKIGYISVINEPKVKIIVGGHINLSVWIYASIVGFLIGVGFCILRFVFAPTVINEDDITALFGIDTLGALPFDKHYARLKPSMTTDLPIMDDIKSSAHLLLSHMEGAGVHKVYVTSTKHDEGKTRLIADVGLQFARLGKKTLIIDCNFQNPMLGGLFLGELPYEKTLNALYRGDADKLDAVTRINGCLDLLPCVLERNPENFNDALLVELHRVMEDYDYVLIDTAPVGTDAEVLRLNEITETVLYVVRFDHAKVDDIKRSMERIAKSGIPVVGAVFNCVVNWRQTIINTPKRLANSLKREKKRQEKQTKQRRSYQDKRAKANKKSGSAPRPAKNRSAWDESADTESISDKKEATDDKNTRSGRQKLRVEEKKNKAEEKKRKAEEKKNLTEEKKRKAEEKKNLAEEKKRKAEEKKNLADEKKRLKAEEKKTRKDKKSNPQEKTITEDISPISEYLDLEENFERPENTDDV